MFCITTKSQTGLGDFKLNKTKVDFVISKYPCIKEITDSTDCPLVRKFVCQRYKMLNIDILNIRLIFYNDILIDFKCDRDPLIEKYFVSKHGRPHIKQDNHSVIFENVSYSEEINEFKWIDKNITTISTYTKQFNEFFNIIVDSYFNIYIKDIEKITNCNGHNN
jgi:hypothetical protein